MNKVVRFAPSPTGNLHIGGGRTAIFNFLFAQKYNAKCVLRIEDTDPIRSKDEYIQDIKNSLEWVGVKFDEILYQSKMKERHLALIDKLIKNGSAYYDYESTDKEHPEPAIRIKVPKDEVISFYDNVYGEIKFNSEDIKDFVIARSDGSPTFLSCVVFDDIYSKVTDIIRGDDHLSNVPKQILIYQALGEKVPNFTHLPLIHDSEGKKLSKRKMPTSLIDYKDMGYLPEAVYGYLSQLGCSYKIDELELLQDVKKYSEHFNINSIGRSPARFDLDRLNFFNLKKIQSLSEEEIYDLIKKDISLENHDDMIKYKNNILSGLKEIKKESSLKEIKKNILKYIPSIDIEYENDAFNLINNSSKSVISDIREFFETGEEIYQSEELFSERFKAFLKEKNYKFKDIGPLIRSILIGKSHSFALSNIVCSLKKEGVLKRINFCKLSFEKLFG